jgi:glucosyl-3-phosphoglycerate synthase
MSEAPIRTYHHRQFPAGELVGRKAGRRISVCVPARDEEATIGPIVESTRAALVEAVALVDEILVVDDGSTDDTAAVAGKAGARVVSAPVVLSDHGAGPGKGQALWKALWEAEGDLLVFCDADVVDFTPVFVTGLLGPLLTEEDVALVKGAYQRPLRGADGGGRVTELTARPLIAALFPDLSGVRQPLAGETAAPRSVLERLAFPEGYGVELGLLVDVAARHGAGSITQVDLGERHHRNRPLAELGPVALAILLAALERSGVAAAELPAVIDRPGLGEVAVAAAERPPLVEVPGYLRRRGRSAR